MGRAHDQSAKRARLLVTKLEREGTAINCTWIIITEIQNTIGGGGGSKPHGLDTCPPVGKVTLHTHPDSFTRKHMHTTGAYYTSRGDIPEHALTPVKVAPFHTLHSYAHTSS